MELLRSNLTENEIKFMIFWENVKKYNISSHDLDKSANLLNINRTGGCASCLRNDAITINNKYKLLLPSYKEYLNLEKIKAEKVEKKTKRGKKSE